MFSLFERGMHSLGRLFIRLVTRPQMVNPQQLLPAQGSMTRVYYILEHNRLSHKLLLQDLLRQQLRQIDTEQILIAHSSGQAPLRETLLELVEAQRSNPELNTLIVPVSIFHGRLPHREKSWLNLLYAETWHRAGPLGSALQLLVNGRQTLVRVDQALELQQLVEEEESTAAVARKAARVLRTHFSIIRQSIIGPDLSHRRTLISLVLKHPEVQQAIDQQAQEQHCSRYKVERHCVKTLDRIAANFSPITARILDPIFNWVWKRLYHEVRVHNVEPIQEIAKTHQLIYLPCHRSHMDYLLLSWALYRNGLMIPHVAAGENLNIPLIGPILKRGGAIFMRRKFQGDPLYASLYKAYLEQMSHRGHALEYFIEGGRSRTGRLLPAKTGLLSMSIESFRQGSPRPVALIPVWIGYDRLVESRSYQQELAGEQKQTESVSDLFSTLGILKEKFGATLLSFGTPIPLQQATDPERPLRTEVRQISHQVMCEINQAAGLTQSSLLASCILAGSQLQSVAELGDKCNRLLNLLQALSTRPMLTPQGKASDWIKATEQMAQLQISMNLVEVDHHQAQELSFYRNNIQHLLVLPGLYLLLAHRLEKGPTQAINRTIRMVYPFLEAELFLPYSIDQLTIELRRMRQVLLEQNLLEPRGPQGWKTTNNPLVNTLILTVEPILLRYYIVLRVLQRYTQISREDLIHSSQQIAEQIHLEYGYSTPEYKDQRVLDSFIRQLRTMELINEQEGRLLLNFDPAILFRQAGKILRPHMISLIDSKLKH
ncbi:glycerol-3-phosphate 1-O-acyltransferase PlsB [Neptuniibacter halophilus]|uniref:glycerol-3-phosphate 1-O-acyltransferase PlsB n=1 Tax=Neptuniibacter halophilus TaxID=651666 RepID=UPI00257435F2|nr:glycerol-3-phosphate 1-O-acyltransferase PlsB [Neptuniibacter halophilus]